MPGSPIVPVAPSDSLAAASGGDDADGSVGGRVICPDGFDGDVGAELELAAELVVDGRTVPVVAEPETTDAQPAHSARASSAAAGIR